MLGVFNKTSANRTAKVAAFDEKVKDIVNGSPTNGAQSFLGKAAATFATVEEYVDWVEKYLKQGGKISMVTAANMAGPNNHVYIARQDAALYMSDNTASLNVIVPEGVHVSLKGQNASLKSCGRSQLYLNDGSIESGSADIGITLYADSAAELKRRGYSLQQLKSLYVGPTWHCEDDMAALKSVFREQPKSSAPSLKV